MHLNVGSHDKKIPGFVNLDLEPLGDVCCDVIDGLPVADGSVDGVYSEHFIEHLPPEAAVAFLRECRGVNRPGGRIRVAAPDLEFLVRRYLDPGWREMGDMLLHGLDWVTTPAEQLNISMRHWGHQWMYDETELARIARIAGLEVLGRRPWGESDHEPFVGLEYRPGSHLVMELANSRPAIRHDEPLVSILIAAWNPTYLDEALSSARAQTWTNLEILVGDDCPDDSVAQIVAAHRAVDERIHHHRNPERLGGRANYVALFERARGTYVKYLNDDDVLDPRCVERMARCLNAHPEVTLVTSHRQRIDAAGRPLADDGATVRPVAGDTVIGGPSAVGDVMRRRVNWIGEPTTTMFRRADVDGAEPDLFSFGGRQAPANVDVTLWTQLLSRGDLVYLADSLSSFRQHDGQLQRAGGFLARALRAWDQIAFDAQRLGLVGRRPGLAARPLDDKPWWQGEVRALLEEVDGHLAGGRPDEALALLGAALALAPDDADLHVLRGDLHRAVGDGDEAVADYLAAIELAPGHVRPLVQLAELALASNDIEVAATLLRRAAGLVPGDADVSAAAAAIAAAARSTVAAGVGG